MNSLFAKGSLMILESLSFTKTLYAFDFDGTLSKIVASPSDAVTTPTVGQLMNRLSKLVPVAVVSGRGLEDLKRKVSFDAKYLIGNHGIEGLSAKSSSLEDARMQSLKWKSLLDRVRFEPGIELENKVYSLAIHFRNARNKKSAKKNISERISELMPAPHLIWGKSVVNLLPQGAPHKGAAVLELMRLEGAKHALYVGDDDTDEDVFSLPESRIMAVRVGRKESSAASYYIERQSDISRLLKTILGFYSLQYPEKTAPK